MHFPRKETWRDGVGVWGALKPSILDWPTGKTRESVCLELERWKRLPDAATTPGACSFLLGRILPRRHGFLAGLCAEAAAAAEWGGRAGGAALRSLPRSPAVAAWRGPGWLPWEPGNPAANSSDVKTARRRAGCFAETRHTYIEFVRDHKMWIDYSNSHWL